MPAANTEGTRVCVSESKKEEKKEKKPKFEIERQSYRMRNKRSANKETWFREDELSCEQREEILSKDLLNIEYGSSSVMMRATGLYEPKFRECVVEMISESGYVEKEELINSGSYVAGCSQETATRYLKKLTSLKGPLMTVYAPIGERGTLVEGVAIKRRTLEVAG